MYRIFRKANVFNRLKHRVALTCACRTSANKRSSVAAIISSGSILKITVKGYVTEGESRPIPFKNGLSVRFGSDDSGTPNRQTRLTNSLTFHRQKVQEKVFPILRLTRRSRPLSTPCGRLVQSPMQDVVVNSQNLKRCCRPALNSGPERS
jgi:hypothetical protein